MPSLILALDSATPVGSVALWRDDTCLYAAELAVERAHSARLTVMLQEALAHASVKSQALSAIAVSVGPGSYTGLRIGVSAAKGMCMALDIPLLAIDTLQAYAMAARPFLTQSLRLQPVIDARRDEVYTAGFAPDALERLSPTAPLVLQEGALDEALHSPVLFLGNGTEKVRRFLATHPKKENAHFWSSALPNVASGVARLGQLAYAQGDFADLAYLEPQYLKPFQAITSTKNKALVPKKKAL